MNAHAPVVLDMHPELEASWTETVEGLRTFVASRVDDKELADDITQDVIVRSIASGALDRVDNPAAWLYRSARNAVIDHYRTRRRHAPLDGLDAWPAQELDDAGYHVVSDGWHRRLKNDLSLTYAKTSIDLTCDTAFRYKLEVTKTPIT